MNGTVDHILLGAITMAIALLTMRTNWKVWFFTISILTVVELTQYDVFRTPRWLDTSHDMVVGTAGAGVVYFIKKRIHF